MLENNQIITSIYALTEEIWQILAQERRSTYRFNLAGDETF
jgi:hypothetical protein